MRALVLSEHDLASWRALYDKGERPTALPYGVEALAEVGYQLGSAEVPSGPFATRVRHAIEHRAGFPVARTLAAVPKAAGADLVVALLEGQGRAAAWAKGHHLPPYARTPLLVWSCWLADDLSRMPADERRAYADTMRHADLVTYLARAETEILLDAGFSAEQLFPMTYGVAADFYTPTGQPKDIDVLAVGQDRGRDYATLFDAVRGTGIAVDVVCKPANLAGLDIPAEVTVHGPVPHVAYRALLRRAKVVAVPTVELTYPTGSSVTLEASSCGACVVVSDTRSMREYVSDDESGLLVGVGDVDGWRAALTRSLDDDALRARLGTGARASVTTRFNTRHMWHELAGVLQERGIV